MIEELCVAGACHRGISYIGALKKLKELGILKLETLKKVIGVSIGSFVMYCFMAGYDFDDFFEHVMNTEISLFKDIDICENAVLKGSIFRSWIYESISKCGNPNITILEFYKKTGIDFTIVTTCLETGIVYMNHKTFPNTRIYDALVCSMNVPIVFPPYVLDGYTYIDGGLLENFPLHLLGPNAVGITSKRKRNKIGPFAQIDNMMNLISKHIEKINKPRSTLVINVASDDQFLSFDITADDKVTLYRRGFESMLNDDTVHKLLFIMKWKNVVDELNKLKFDE